MSVGEKQLPGMASIQEVSRGSNDNKLSVSHESPSRILWENMYENKEKKKRTEIEIISVRSKHFLIL